MKLKIAIVGPSEAGKTTLANLLSNDNPEAMAAAHSSGYRPTDSVRIVEMSIPSIELKKYNTELDIQLWEIGGNPRLKPVWPAIQRDLDGVVIVYNVHNEAHIRDSSGIHMHFVTHSPSPGGEMQCFLVGNTFKGMREIGPQRILGVSKRVRHIAMNIEDESNSKTIKDEFMQFITSVAQSVHEREKSNLAGMKSCSGNFFSTKSKKLTATDLRNECISMTKNSKHSSSSRRTISTALPSEEYWGHSRNNGGGGGTSRTRLDTAICDNSFTGPKNKPRTYRRK